MAFYFRRLQRFAILFCLSLVASFLCHGIPNLITGVAVASESGAAQLVRQGVEQYQAGSFEKAIATWKAALAQTKDAKEHGVIHNNLAQAYRQIGQLDKAITQWQEAITNYRAMGDRESQSIALAMIDQAQAYIELGQNRQAIALLCGETQNVPNCNSDSAFAIASRQKNNVGQATASGALGDAYTSLGDYEIALQSYQQGIKQAQSFNSQSYLTTIYNNLGNLYVQWAERYRFQARSAFLEGDRRESTRLKQLEQEMLTSARKSYEQSLQYSQSVGSLAQATALLNLNRFLEKSFSSERDHIWQNRSLALKLLSAEPASRAKAYGLINLAKSLHLVPLSDQDTQASRKLLEQAMAVAQSVGDRRAESFALGSLGQLEEDNKRYDLALHLTQEAQFAAQEVNAAESLYLWQWQAGRILNQQPARDKAGAIRSYKTAIATLQRVRSDIISANRDLQFNFRDSVEPVYRELMALLLERETGEKVSVGCQVSGVGCQATELTADAKLKTQTISSGNATRTNLKPQTLELKPRNSQLSTLNSPFSTLNSSLSTLLPSENIQEALDILERLKLAELQNYFGDECVQLAQGKSEQNSIRADRTAAIVYSVILADHTEMILRSPGSQQLVSYFVPISHKQMQEEINKLRGLLEEQSNYEYIPQAERVYNFLIRPLEADLAAAKPKTVVFVNDGVLRNVPMSALYDGKQFLVEKYAIATAPSLNLTSGNPLNRKNLRALTAGLSLARPPFPGLKNVPDEAEGVRSILGGVKLLDRQFTLENLSTTLKQQNYPIVHMATHGKFGVDADSTFLQAFDNRIRIDQIDTLLRTREAGRPVELLTLSACQTAAGDERTALGIAGVAVRAGVASVVATLWYINDEAAVQFIKTFYEQLRKPEVTRAEALRNAQTAMIKDNYYQHPAYWSPFILIGNWL